MKISTILNELRETRGLNKQELANKVDISRSYISRIESGSIEKPSKKVLLKLAYVFDPENKHDIYELLLSATGYDSENSNEEFQEYIDEVIKNFSIEEKKVDKSIAEMCFRVNDHDNSMVTLDYPYMNIEWLLGQDDFKVFLGNDVDSAYIDVQDNKKYFEPFILNEREKRILKDEVTELKEAFVFRRRQKERQKDIKEKETEIMEYKLMIDLLSDNVDERQLIERLALIDDDREIFVAKEYHEEIRKAANNKDAITLQKLVRMKTIEELQQFLSEH